MKPSRDLVALVLAIGLALGIVGMITSILINSVQNQAAAPLSDNATQVLTAAFSGIIGALGAYMGFQAGVRSEREKQGPQQE